MRKNALIAALEGGELNETRTWNGAKAYKSTLDANLDWFGGIGGVRGKTERAVDLFSAAYRDEPLVATKILFYGRDIRGGQGERDTFRACLKWLVNHHPNVVRKNLALISEYGRWDDLYALMGTDLQLEALNLFVAQLKADMANLRDEAPVSLAGKWAKSENASSKETAAFARLTREAWGLSSKQYRKALTALRAAIRVVECDMSAKRWESIDYSGVPSRAMHIHSKAFKKNDEVRFANFLEKVEKGETKINAGALFPYDLTKRYVDKSYYSEQKVDPVVEAQWKALPNYLEGHEHNALVVCDVSGSMLAQYHDGMARPIDVSTSLALYIAERNIGAFHNVFMTYSDDPKLIKISDNETLAAKVRRTLTDIGYSTNLQKVFETLLKSAVRDSVSADEMPEVIYIISDMQFNSVRPGQTNFEAIEAKYEAAGYARPKLVFWNVNDAGNVPIKASDHNTALVSGCNPTIFKQIISGETPVEVMLQVVENERYERISV